MSSLTRQSDALITTIYVLIATVSLAATYFGVGFSNEMVVVLLCVGVGLLGLPHGALDPQVARNAGLWHSYRELASFLLIYASIAAAAFWLWTLLPAPALLTFLIVSAIHFSVDWKESLPTILRLPIGIAIIILPTWQHPDTVDSVFATLTAEPSAAALVNTLGAFGPTILAVSIVGAAVAAREHFRSSLEIVLTIALAIVLHPLLFFAIYFCFLHSPRHCLEIYEQTARVHRENLRRYGVIFGGVGVLILIFIAASFESPDWAQTAPAAIFMGLAALTIPHMLLMNLTDSETDPKSSPCVFRNSPKI